MNYYVVHLGREAPYWELEEEHVMADCYVVGEHVIHFCEGEPGQLYCVAAVQRTRVINIVTKTLTVYV